MELLCKPVGIVWAALMLATCASTWLLTKSSVTSEVATVAIMLVAAVKVRLVMRHFMEVRRAPPIAPPRGDGYVHTAIPLHYRCVRTLAIDVVQDK